jgi:hypothetical protein
LLQENKGRTRWKGRKELEEETWKETDGQRKKKKRDEIKRKIGEEK